jgi:Superfamily I DNA and RNA helicases
MAILYRTARQAHAIGAALERAGIPFASTVGSRGKRGLFDEAETVKVISMHSSKGLEFGWVLIPCLGEMPGAGEAEEDEARLLYVAMTRAIDRLVMTCRGSSGFTRRVQDAIAGARGRLEPPDAFAGG